MRIVYIYGAFALYGGIEKILIEKMNYLSQFPDYHLYVITTYQGEHPISFPLSPKVTHIDLNIRFHTVYQYKLLLQRIYHRYKLNNLFKEKFKKCIDEIQPDIIVATSIHHTKAVIELPCKAKKVIECHTDRSQKNYTSNWIKRKIHSVINLRNNKSVSKADALVTLTNESAKEWASIKKALVIPNMISPSPVNTISPLSKRVIAVGRLVYEKGFDILIDAWLYVYKKHPDWSLHIFGDGSKKDKLTEQINQLGLTNNIKIHEPTKYIYDEYSKSSIFVMSSRSEPFGLVLAEAMSCGLPCVAFNCPYGPRNIIEHNKNGILINGYDKKELSKKINYLIENESIRVELGKGAKVSAKRFYPENIIPKWKYLFEELVKHA